MIKGEKGWFDHLRLQKYPTRFRHKQIYYIIDFFGFFVNLFKKEFNSIWTGRCFFLYQHPMTQQLFRSHTLYSIFTSSSHSTIVVRFHNFSFVSNWTFEYKTPIGLPSKCITCNQTKASNPRRFVEHEIVAIDRVMRSHTIFRNPLAFSFYFRTIMVPCEKQFRLAFFIYFCLLCIISVCWPRSNGVWREMIYIWISFFSISRVVGNNMRKLHSRKIDLEFCKEKTRANQ